MVNKTKIGLMLVLVFCASLTIVLATHIITTSIGTTRFNPTEDVSSFYNITVNNTDPLDVGNITRVDITVPNSFTITPATNGTNAIGNVSLSSNNLTLTFTNVSSFLINGSSAAGTGNYKYFWFNATASTPGSFNISVMTFNITSNLTSNITIVVNDTTAPATVGFVNGTTEIAGANLSQTTVGINVSATDNGVLDTITIWFHNGTDDVINTSYSAISSSSFYVNYTALGEGYYKVNASVNDTYNNMAYTGLRTFQLDTTAPNVTVNTPSNYINSTVVSYNFTFNATDGIGDIKGCILYWNSVNYHNMTPVLNASGPIGMYNTSLAVGAYQNWTVNCTDMAGNQGGSAVRVLTVMQAAGDQPEVPDAGTGGGGGGGGGATTYNPSSSELSSGYTKSLGTGSMVKFSLSDGNHTLTMNSVSASTATIKITSATVLSTLGIGQVGKYELTNDKYYDISVKLNSITGTTASITVTKISERMKGSDEPAQVETPSETPSTPPGQAKKEPQLSPEPKDIGAIVWGIVLVVIAIGAIIGIGYAVKMNRNKSKSAAYFPKFKK
ncbi:MAG: hypothetical protein ABIH72_00560 [archaeon]